MNFKYFENPEAFTTLNSNKVICGICQIDKNCFDAELFFGEDELSSICPECLGNGDLINRDIYTCNGDFEELRKQLSRLNPSLDQLEIKKIAENKTTELEKNTPYLVTWQEWNWPCIEGDYAKFIGFGSRPFYENLANNISAEFLFKNSFYGDLKNETDVDYLWDEIISEKPIKDFKSSNEYATLFYVFKSLTTNKIITIWDCA